MRDQILKIIDDRVNNVGGYENMSLPQIIEIIASTTDIANMIKDFILWLFKADNVWTDCTGIEPVTQIEIKDKVCSIDEAFDYWYNNIYKTARE